jgi:uncharacterized membrane-anchored protein YhcB (DUF1043 family)
MDVATLLIILFFIIPIFIGFLVYSVISRKQEDQDYQDTLDDLYNQLQSGRITVEKYHELRNGLEVQYHRTQRDRGF